MTLRRPTSRTEEVEDVLAGVRFHDPYRWLEETTAEVKEWQRQQDDLVSERIGGWPHREALRKTISRFSTPRFAELPQWAAGRWFRRERSPEASSARVIVSDDPFGEGDVLFDPVANNSSNPPIISWFAPSPDGCTLALGLCHDGSEQNSIQLCDVASGNELPEPPRQTLMDDWTCGVTWLPDSSGFFFSAIEGDPTGFDQQIFLHTRGGSPRTTMVDAPKSEDSDYRAVTLSPDGRYAILLEGIPRPRPIAVGSVDGHAPPRWRPFVTDFDGSVAGHVVGDEYIAVVTDASAPRGQVVAISLSDEDAASDPTKWRLVVPPSDAVIQAVHPAGGCLFVIEMVDTYARIRIVAPTGEELGEVPLPGRGALGVPPFPMMGAILRAHPTDFLFSFATLTESWATYRFATGPGEVQMLKQPLATVEGAVVRDRWAIASDGAHIPYHLVHLSDVPLSTAQPVLVSGYGGFNAPWTPQFPGPLAAFVEAGGVFVHTHLRGGSDLGREWWQQGRLKAKQQTFDDLYAVAEDLISTGVTTPGQMSLTGGSNGGLLCGAAITQRPELWRAVVPRVPLLDLIGACRDGYGRMAVGHEYADPDDPDEVRRLASLSPYHLLREGRPYPAVYLVAGATDPRCPPWHARKFAARLQAVADQDTVVLLKVWDDAGHGAATRKDTVIASDTDWLAFVMSELDMSPA